jgi:hypothetical protein
LFVSFFLCCVDVTLCAGQENFLLKIWSWVVVHGARFFLLFPTTRLSRLSPSAPLPCFKTSVKHSPVLSLSFPIFKLGVRPVIPFISPLPQRRAYPLPRAMPQALSSRQGKGEHRFLPFDIDIRRSQLKERERKLGAKGIRHSLRRETARKQLASVIVFHLGESADYRLFFYRSTSGKNDEGFQQADDASSSTKRWRFPLRRTSSAGEDLGEPNRERWSERSILR